MAGIRAYYPDKLEIGTNITLSQEESHHLVNVMRLKIGDEVYIINGNGFTSLGIINNAHPKKAMISISSIQASPPPSPEICLIQAVPKGKNMDMIVRQATEIGISQIIPLITARSEVKLDPDRANKKREHWKNIAVEACKQSGNPFIPLISPLTNLTDQFLSSLATTSSKIICASLEENSKNIHQVPHLKNYKRLYCLVGPEGDFTSQEYQLIQNHQSLPIRLSKNVLRVETASIYLLSIIDSIL